MLIYLFRKPKTSPFGNGLVITQGCSFCAVTSVILVRRRQMTAQMSEDCHCFAG